MTHYAVICEVCGKVGKPNSKVPRSMPAGWRRITLSNPESLNKRGVSAIVCQSLCGKKFIKDHWEAKIGVAA